MLTNWGFPTSTFNDPFFSDVDFFPTTLRPATTARQGGLIPFGERQTGLFDFNTLLNQPVSFGLNEDDKQFTLEVHRPRGIRKRDLRVELQDNVLTVHGERTRRKQGRDEVESVSFSRSIRLPDNANIGAIEATYDNDTLQVCIPKVGHGRRQIAVKGAQQQAIEQGKEQGKELGKEQGQKGQQHEIAPKHMTDESEKKDPMASSSHQPHQIPITGAK